MTNEIISMDSVIDLIKLFVVKAVMFPLTFTKLTGSNKSRKYALGTIATPTDIATFDVRPITRDWTYICFGFPKEEYKKYMEDQK